MNEKDKFERKRSLTNIVDFIEDLLIIGVLIISLIIWAIFGIIDFIFNSYNFFIASMIGIAFGGSIILFWRIQERRKKINKK